MKPLGSCTWSRRFSCFARRRWHRPRSAMLSLALLGLSIGISNAQTTTTAQPGDHVYLLRGFANVFSLGMDQIATKLQQRGIHATVDNYLAWPSLAEQAAAEYKSGRVRTIILVGHSSGAIAVTEMAARLSQLGVPVKLAIGLDPTSRMTTTGHVDRYINYYIAHGFGDPVDRGQGFSGVLQNVDLEHMSNVSHFNIDKNNVLQSMVIRDILAAVSSGPTQARNACDLHSGGKSCGSSKPGTLTEGTIGAVGR
jgi:pimeloyl-ACP methyl ester carboxylesterase